MMAHHAAATELLNDICQCEDDCDDNCRCQHLDQPCTAACDCSGFNYDYNDRECANPLPLALVENENDKQ